MVDRLSDVGAAELEALKVLWDEGPSTVRQVHGHLHARGRRVAYTTVLTMMTRLEQKGFLSSDKSGLAHVYKATVSRERVSRSRLKTLLSELYDGAAGSLVLHLVKSERLSTDEIAELQRLLDELDKPDKRPPKSDRGRS